MAGLLQKLGRCEEDPVGATDNMMVVADLQDPQG